MSPFLGQGSSVVRRLWSGRLASGLSPRYNSPPHAINTLDDALSYAAGDALACAVVQLGLSRAQQLLGGRIPGVLLGGFRRATSCRDGRRATAVQ